MRPIISIVLSFLFSTTGFAAGKAEHIVVVVWDGMRPDFMTEQYTPALHQLAQEGVFFQNHHPVYLSATEVNGTAISTGAYPAHSGIMANKEYRPRLDMLKAVGTESSETVRAGDRLTKGRYLSLPTIAEILQSRGYSTAIAGTKAVALLHDRKERDERYRLGKILFTDKTLPTNASTQLIQALGPYPKSAQPNAARDEWTTRALAGPFWKDGVPKFSLLWLSEPDFSQHDFGPGSETAVAALKSVEADPNAADAYNNLARVLGELERRGLRGKTDIFVVSDHGFSTITQTADVAKVLQGAGFKAAREFKRPPSKDDILVISNGGATLLYVIGRDSKLIRKVVAFLQRQEFTGVLFTRKPVEGAFTLDQASIKTPNAPDILIALRWASDKSSNGTAGLVFCDESGRKPGQGMHVTLSRFDMHNTLIASGPDFRHGAVDELPTGNVDIAPTILWILGIKPPKPMDGRVLTEALMIDGPKVGAPKTTRIEAAHQKQKSVWRQYLQRTELNGVIYLDEGNGGLEPR